MTSYSGVILGGAAAWGAYLFVKVRAVHSLLGLSARAGPSQNEHTTNALMAYLHSRYVAGAVSASLVRI